MISSVALKCFAGSQKVASGTLENCGFVNPQGRSCRSTYHIQNNLNYIQIKIVKVKPQRNRNIFVPTICAISKHNLSRRIHQRFGHVSIDKLKIMARKGLMEGLPTNLPDLE